MMDDQGNSAVLAKEPCPKCGSKDNLVRYQDGHAHCFSPSCKHWEPAWAAGEKYSPGTIRKAKVSPLEPEPDAYLDLKARGLKAETLRRFGYFRAALGGMVVQVAPYYNDHGLAYHKVRTADKTFPTFRATDEVDTSLTEGWLYGRQVWGDKHDKKVVITTGEHDAHSCAQAESFKFPCVSVPTGDQGAVKALQANYQWLDRFKEIILFFDLDKSGQGALAEAASLFDPGKVKVVTGIPGGFKDPNEALAAGKPGAITEAIWTASSWRPVGIVNAADGLEEFLAEGSQIPSWPYPTDDMNKVSLGMRPGEITYHIGGTGIAKTTLLFLYVEHLLEWEGGPFITITDNQTGVVKDYPCGKPPKIGWLGFEDTLKSVKMGLLSMHAHRRLHLDPLPDDQMREVWNSLFGSRRLEVYDPETAEYGLEPIMGYIKYMVKALGCKIIVIDPLSFLMAGLGARDRTALEDRIAAELAALSKRLNVHIHVSYHLKKSDGTPFEEGGEISIVDIKGSGALGHFANNIIAYERNSQGERPDLLRVRGLKFRYTGLTGVLGVMKYDYGSGRYEPTDEDFPEEKKGKRDGGKRSKSWTDGGTAGFTSEY